MSEKLWGVLAGLIGIVIGGCIVLGVFGGVAYVALNFDGAAFWR